MLEHGKDIPANGPHQLRDNYRHHKMDSVLIFQIEDRLDGNIDHFVGPVGWLCQANARTGGVPEQGVDTVDQFFLLHGRSPP